jgi:hypothetical protein
MKQVRMKIAVTITFTILHGSLEYAVAAEENL